MKRFLPIFTLLICVLCFGSCDSIFGNKYFPLQGNAETTPEENQETYGGREVRSFYAYNFTEPNADSAKNFYTLEAVHLAENNSCIVYGERSAGISLAAAARIAEEFQKNILNKISGIFGPVGIMPGNKQKFVLFLLDIQDGAEDAQTPYIAGYFDYHDLLGRNSYPYSNELGMIYLDVKPGIPESGEFYATIAHELQHNINFIASVDYRRAEDNSIYLMDTWVDEGLSSAAEDIYLGRRLSARIDHFNQDPYGTIAQGNNFYVWDNHGENQAGIILDEYATVYLFFQWLRIHAANGTGIYKDIISSRIIPITGNPSEFTGYGAVTRAVKNRFTLPPSRGGSQNEWGQWEVVLREWLLANYLNLAAGEPSPTLGYKGEINTKTREIAAPLIQLAPGEGVFSIISSQFALREDQADKNIGYAGISGDGTIHMGYSSGKTQVFTGNRLLAYNKNQDNALYKYKIENNQYVLDPQGNRIVEEDNSLFGTGYLTGVGSAGGGNRQIYKTPQPFVIDAGDFLRNRKAPDRLGINYGKQ
ncbi:MAG: hypothetical protein LBT95_07680 [Treponema sp.]|jgi:hypothetical protein|nr:hypothetical protein [Treponema sp.]